MVMKSSQPPPRNGYEFEGAASRTEGNCRSAARSDWICESICLSDDSPAHWLSITNRLASSMPVGSERCARRCWMMNKALQTIASVSAICSAISTVPARWRRSAARMGWICMGTSIGFEMPSRLHLRGAPGGIKRRQYRREDCDRKGQCDQRHVHVRQPRDLRLEQQAHAGHPYGGQQQSQQATGQSDDAGLDQELQVDLATGRTECATHADFARAAQELGQQQSNGVDQADRQEARRNQQGDAALRRYDFLVFQPLGDIAQAHVGRPAEASGPLLVGGIAFKEAAVTRDLAGTVQFHPRVDPDTVAVQIGVPAADVVRLPAATVVAVGADLQVHRAGKRDVEIRGLTETALAEQREESRQRIPVYPRGG